MAARDWFVVLLMGAIWIASTAFIFLHPDTANFGIWAGITGTMASAYHWMVIRDQKVPDA